MMPWLDDGDVRLYQGDALEVLRGLPSGSVHMCATSPPFYGLRDYGTGEWEGGDPDCDHKTAAEQKPRSRPELPNPPSGWAERDVTVSRAFNECPCGARRVDQQIGLEETPDQWVDRLVAVFREVKRVLRDDGVLFIEIGDSYVSSEARRGARRDGNGDTAPADSPASDSSGPGLCGECGGDRSIRNPHSDQPPHESAELDGAIDLDSALIHGSSPVTEPRDVPPSTTPAGARVPLVESLEPVAGSRPEHRTPPAPSALDARASAGTRACTCDTSPIQPSSADRNRGTAPSRGAYRSVPIESLPPKSLLGQPWRLAFALQDDGWILRSEIIFARPNPMPESVTDRPTKSHSTVFLLSKRPRYFFDADAIREPHAEPWRSNGKREAWDARVEAGNRRGSWVVPGSKRDYNPLGANARSVWLIPTEPTPFAHFATWPQALVRRMVLAGTSERGCCPGCGAPWVRETEVGELIADAPGYKPRGGTSPDGLVQAGMGWRSGQGAPNHHREKRHIGWSPSCACVVSFDYVNPAGEYVEHRPPPVAIPCTVLDPFAGSGTTNLVARNHGRHSIGIELNPAYLEIAAKRLQQLSLLTEGATQ